MSAGPAIVAMRAPAAARAGAPRHAARATAVVDVDVAARRRRAAAGRRRPAGCRAARSAGQRVVAVQADEERAVDVAGRQVVGRSAGRRRVDAGMSRTSCRSRAARARADTPRRSRGKNGSLNSRPAGSVMTTAIDPLRRVTRLGRPGWGRSRGRSIAALDVAPDVRADLGGAVDDARDRGPRDAGPRATSSRVVPLRPDRVESRRGATDLYPSCESALTLAADYSTACQESALTHVRSRTRSVRTGVAPAASTPRCGRYGKLWRMVDDGDARPAGRSTRYEAVIGIEVHCQLRTASKMFCGCSTAYDGAPPNSHVCPVCLGLPGALPVINRAGRRATSWRRAWRSRRRRPAATRWDRKNYFYPDLPKGYQISQYDLPLASRGPPRPSRRRTARSRSPITRAHLEEDTAKLVHARRHGRAAGQPGRLQPLRGAAHGDRDRARDPDRRAGRRYAGGAPAAAALDRRVRCRHGARPDCASRRTSRCAPRGTEPFGTRVEVKNMNSFRAVERAIEYEIERQAAALDAGEPLVQETRGWSEERGETYRMRVKETSDDYRYFPEPDLPPLHVEPAWLAAIARRACPSCPPRGARATRTALGLSAVRRRGARRRSRTPTALFEATPAAAPDLPSEDRRQLGHRGVPPRSATPPRRAIAVDPAEFAALIRGGRRRLDLARERPRGPRRARGRPASPARPSSRRAASARSPTTGRSARRSTRSSRRTRRPWPTTAPARSRRSGSWSAR